MTEDDGEDDERCHLLDNVPKATPIFTNKSNIVYDQ